MSNYRVMSPSKPRRIKSLQRAMFWSIWFLGALIAVLIAEVLVIVWWAFIGA